MFYTNRDFDHKKLGLFMVKRGLLRVLRDTRGGDIGVGDTGGILVTNPNPNPLPWKQKGKDQKNIKSRGHRVWDTGGGTGGAQRNPPPLQYQPPPPSPLRPWSNQKCKKVRLGKREGVGFSEENRPIKLGLGTWGTADVVGGPIKGWERRREKKVCPRPIKKLKYFFMWCFRIFRCGNGMKKTPNLPWGCPYFKEVKEARKFWARKCTKYDFAMKPNQIKNCFLQFRKLGFWKLRLIPWSFQTKAYFLPM